MLAEQRIMAAFEDMAADAEARAVTAEKLAAEAEVSAAVQAQDERKPCVN